MISKMTSAIAATAKCRSVTDPGTEADATTDGIVLFRRIPLMLRPFIRIGMHFQALVGAGVPAGQRYPGQFDGFSGVR
jgi:hypothetical protein